MGALGFIQHDPGPISLQVQISYYCSHKPLPLAYAVLYLTCVGKLAAMLRVWPTGLSQGRWRVVGNDTEQGSLYKNQLVLFLKLK